MITRTTLAALAVFTLVDFAVCGLLGNHGHGVRQAFADITWFAFLVSLLFLIVGSAVVLIRSRGSRRTALNLGHGPDRRPQTRGFVGGPGKEEAGDVCSGTRADR